MRVYVVTSVELGWDCVIAVYNSNDVGEDELEVRYPQKRGYVIHSELLQSEIDDE